MLTDSAYLTALLVYSLSAVAAVLLLIFWLLRGRSLAVKALLSLPLLSLLVTPALIEPGADTFAPAIVVALFQWFTQGQEAAAHALKPLALFTGLALGLGLVLALIFVFLNRGSVKEKAT